jgi:hypothetical protein
MADPRSSIRVVLAVLAVLAALAVGLAGEEPRVVSGDEWKKKAATLRPGMTPTEVRDLLGLPRRTARQLLYKRYLEQWLYEEPMRLRLDFDCRLGQPPFLLTRPSDLPADRGRKADD